MSLGGRAAIAGIGATEFSKESGRSELQLSAEAMENSLLIGLVVQLLAGQAHLDAQGDQSLLGTRRLYDVFYVHVIVRDGRPTLDLEDPEGQRLSLVADDGEWTPRPWETSPVPAEHQIVGLGPITISVRFTRPALRAEGRRPSHRPNDGASSARRRDGRPRGSLGP